MTTATRNTFLLTTSILALLSCPVLAAGTTSGAAAGAAGGGTGVGAGVGANGSTAGTMSGSINSNNSVSGGASGSTTTTPSSISGNGTAPTTTGTTSNTNSINTNGTSTTGTSANGTNNVNGQTNWNTQSQYWQSNYATRPYYNSNTSYSTYQPAYEYGVNLYNQNNGKPYTSLNQEQLQANWAQSQGTSNLTWAQAQAATRDAYMRLYNNQHPGTTSP